MNDILLPEVLETVKQPEFLLATIASANGSGGTLILDGQEDASVKRYKRLASLDPPYEGDRVVVMKHSGTYIVLGKLVSSYWDWTSSTIASNIITAGSGFSITSASRYRYGLLVQLFVKAKSTSSGSTGWHTVGTMKSGGVPVANVLLTEVGDHASCLYSDGDLKVYGSYGSGAEFEFSGFYIRK